MFGFFERIIALGKNFVLRILLFILGGICIFGLGYLFGMHHRLIVAKLRGEEPPKAPADCPFGTEG